MTNKAKLALIAALAVTRLAATPAFGQSFDEGDRTGNVSPFTYYQSLTPTSVPTAASTSLKSFKNAHL
jgi:hypothetical protein